MNFFDLISASFVYGGFTKDSDDNLIPTFCDIWAMVAYSGMIYLVDRPSGNPYGILKKINTYTKQMEAFKIPNGAESFLTKIIPPVHLCVDRKGTLYIPNGPCSEN